MRRQRQTHDGYSDLSVATCLRRAEDNARPSSMLVCLTRASYSGKLITFSGVDGSGKSTTGRAVRDYLLSKEIRTVFVNALSASCRRLPQFRLYANDPLTAVRGKVDLSALCLICLGDRLMTVRTRLLPLLRKGIWVLCDRYVYTALAEIHTFGGSPDDLDLIRRTIERFPEPDLKVLVDTPAEVAIKRILWRRSERAKRLDLPHYRALVESFRAIAAANGLIRVGTDLGREATLEQLRPHLDQLLIEATTSKGTAMRGGSK
jgi:dTMP kinase